MSEYYQVETLYIREQHKHIYVTLPSGWSDEAQMCFDLDITEAERAPIIDVLSQRMQPWYKVYWRIHRIDTRLVAAKRDWQSGGIWADNPNELAAKLNEYYAKGGI